MLRLVFCLLGMVVFRIFRESSSVPWNVLSELGFGEHAPKARRLERLAVFAGASGEDNESGGDALQLDGVTVLPNVDGSNVVPVLLFLAFMRRACVFLFYLFFFLKRSEGIQSTVTQTSVCLSVVLDLLLQFMSR